jgi:hypothetical protein
MDPEALEPAIDPDDLTAVLRHARKVTRDAREYRIRTRRSGAAGTRRRLNSVNFHLEQLHQAMRPLRRWIGRFSQDPYPLDMVRPVQEISKEMQYERRQLTKMRPRLPDPDEAKATFKTYGPRNWPED